MAAIERRVSVAETVEWLKRGRNHPIVRESFLEQIAGNRWRRSAAPILCMEVTMNTPGATLRSAC